MNKLFALSKRAPVAAMVYGSSELTRVPWETIVKVYRQHLGNTNFARLSEYGAHLMAFLDGRNDLFPAWQQEGEFVGSFHGYCTLILSEIDERIQNYLAVNTSISKTQINSIVSDVIAEHYRMWSRARYLPGRTAGYSARVVRTYSDKIEMIIAEVFGKLTLRPAVHNQLRRLAGHLYAKDRFPDEISGVVVAGFGEREHFPSIVTYEVEGVVINRLKYRKTREHAIGDGAESVVMPFAQREMVSLFREGIDPDFQQQLVQIVQGILNGISDLVLNPLRLRKADQRAVQRRIGAVSKVLGQQFSQWLDRYSDEHHVRPVVRSVGTLPKEELAAMAEALVNLTSFKRRVTHDLETVGGPIDVAVISKGDGLVWIKRKHYFDAVLNPQFIARYSE